MKMALARHECLKTELKIIDLGIIHYFLRIEVWQTVVGIFMSECLNETMQQRIENILG
jgi:hypothetical protein